MFAGLLLLACGRVVEDTSKGNVGTSSNAGVELEGVVHLYSGRPDPTWTIRADEVAPIRERIQGLPSVKTPDNFPRLGELAFGVVNRDHKAQTLPDRMLVGRGVVVITTGTTTATFNDEKGLRELLEKSARAAGVLPP
jgi:hypothetical protein